MGASQEAPGGPNFGVLAWEGDGNQPRNLTGLSFDPDLMWVKERTGSRSHNWTDTNRGLDYYLFGEKQDSEFTDVTDRVLNIVTGGIQVGDDGSFNENGEDYVGWFWKADQAGVQNSNQNEQYSLDSMVSVITYEGDGNTGRVVSHSLGIKPAMIIVKNRHRDNTDWHVYFDTPGMGANYVLNFDDDNDRTSIGIWDNTEPTTTQVTLDNYSDVNDNGDSYVMYVFARKAGVQAVGQYTGTGNINPKPTIDLGFAPTAILFKSSTATKSWNLLDNVRDPSNPVTKTLAMDLAVSELDSTLYGVNFTSTGFEITGTAEGINKNGATYQYYAVRSVT